MDEVGVEEGLGCAAGRGALAGRGSLPVPSRKGGGAAEDVRVEVEPGGAGRRALAGRGGCGSSRPPRSTRDEAAGRRGTRHSGGSSRNEPRACSRAGALRGVRRRSQEVGNALIHPPAKKAVLATRREGALKVLPLGVG